jgi:hypothetical protein
MTISSTCEGAPGYQVAGYTFYANLNAPTFFNEGELVATGAPFLSNKDAQGLVIGWSYGPTIVHVDNTYVMMFCSAENDPVRRGWDSIRMSTSPSGLAGSWSAPTVVLHSALAASNTAKSDHSACDPSLVHFGGYYYLYYTGCPYDNQGAVYVARSVNYGGPYLKYTTRGTWEADPLDPQIVVGAVHRGIPNLPPYDFNPNWYGAGEESVVVNPSGGLTMWYYDDTTGYPTTHSPMLYERTSTDGVSWTGPVLTTIQDWSADSVDVKYNASTGHYVLFATPNKSTASVELLRYTSSDGVNWTASTVCPAGGCLPLYTNNIGVAGDANGWITGVSDNPAFVAFGSPFLGFNSCQTWNTQCMLESIVAYSP